MTVEVNCIATGSEGNAYLLKINETIILLDAGVPIDTIRRANGYRLNNISAALITHAHKDHSLAVGDLLKNCVPVYCHEQIALGVIPDEYKNSVYYFSDDRQVRTLTNAICIFAVMQNHDSHCVGYDIYCPGIIVHYVTDTVSINRKKILTDSDMQNVNEFWICECDYTSQRMAYIDSTESAQVALRNKRTRETHLSSETVTEFFTKYNADRILFVHMSRLNFDEAEFRNTFNVGIPFNIARPGTTYDFHNEIFTSEVST